MSANQTSIAARHLLGAYRRKLIAGATVTVLGLGGLVGVPIAANAEPDTTAPSFVSAETSSDGSVIILNYNETLFSEGPNIFPNQFVVSADTIRTLGAIEISGTTVRINISGDADRIAFGDTVTVSYTNTIEPLQDPSGNDAADLSFTPVTNNVPDTAAPSISGSENVNIDAPSTAVGTYTSDESGVTWSLGGTNSNLFEISTEGVVRFISASTAGEYDIDVIATDAANNSGTLSVTVTVDDVTAPTVSGSSTVSRTSPDTTVATYSSDDGGASWGVSGTNADLFDISNGVLTFISASVAGTYNVTVESEDGSGNIGSVAVTVTVLPDTTDPVITGSSSVNRIAPYTEVATYTANESVTWSLSDTTHRSLFDITSGGEVSFKSAWVVGTYNIVVVATDAGGNIATKAVTVIVSADPGDITSPTIDGSSTVSRTAPETAVATYTANESVTWDIATSADGLRFELLTDGGTVTFVNPSESGTYTFTIVATDDSGNQSSLTVTVTVAPDIIGPTITGDDYVSNPAPYTNVETYTSNEAVTWSLTSSASRTSDRALFEITEGGLLRFLAPWVVGEYYVVVVATDGAGNQTTLEVTVGVDPEDTTSPNIDGSSTVTRLVGETAVATYTADEEDITWTISQEGSLFELLTDGGTVTFVDPAEEGTYYFDIVATDYSGNETSLTVTVIVEVDDQTAPTVSGPQTVNKTAPTTAVATYTSEDGVTWGLSGTNAGLFDIADGVLTFVNPSVAGTYNVTVEATDANENTGTLAVTVIVAAATPPPAPGHPPPPAPPASPRRPRPARSAPRWGRHARCAPASPPPRSAAGRRRRCAPASGRPCRAAGR